MKAYALHGIGDLRLEECPKPIPRKKEVLVQVECAGICGSDIPRIYQTGTYSYPLIPGHEFSGVVVDIGSEADQKWLGKRVGVFPLLPCMACELCKIGKFELCRNYGYLGSRTNGGFAEFTVVPQNNLIELPNEVSFEVAAMLEPMSVGLHAIRKIKPQINDTVVICGMGTIGMILTMLLLQMGFKQIICIGNKEFQKKIIQGWKAPEILFCDSRTMNPLQCILTNTNNKGTDNFFECVGKNDTISLALDSTAPEGKIQMVGNPITDISFKKNIYWKILRNELTLKGGWNSSFIHKNSDDWHSILDYISKNEIFPEQLITHSFRFSDLHKGLDIMRDKTEDYIKIMIKKDK